MNDFKVGDTVLCIEGTRLGTLLEGSRYLVESVDGHYLMMNDELGCVGGWGYTRFRLVSSANSAATVLTGMTQFLKDKQGEKV